jgi:5'-3' exonuclease
VNLYPHTKLPYHCPPAPRGHSRPVTRFGMMSSFESSEPSLKVHLVDGTYELFRAYFGGPPATSPSGLEVGATRTLLRSLNKLLREEDVTHVAVAFDHVIESFRNDLFAGYKTGEGVEPELRDQFSLAERAASALGLVVWPMVAFEADDAMATAAARFSQQGQVAQIVLCSPDKDLCQCVRGDRIVAFDRMRGRLRTEQGVIEKFGVPPASIPDWLALVGDTADGIPGIPRWGSKSAATLLAEYGHLDRIPDDENDWKITVRGAAALSRELRERRDTALLYRTLATLRLDVPLEESVDDLAWEGAAARELEALCEELGDEGFLRALA